jgi:hypothetical protein
MGTPDHFACRRRDGACPLIGRYYKHVGTGVSSANHARHQNRRDRAFPCPPCPCSPIAPFLLARTPQGSSPPKYLLNLPKKITNSAYSNRIFITLRLNNDLSAKDRTRIECHLHLVMPAFVVFPCPSNVALRCSQLMWSCQGALHVRADIPTAQSPASCESGLPAPQRSQSCSA